MSADTIITAAEKLSRALLRNRYRRIPETTIHVATRASCTHIATEDSFTIRVDRDPTPGEIVARIFHAAAHMLCIQAGLSSHSGSGRHTQAFEDALAALRPPEPAPEAEFVARLTRDQQRALKRFMAALHEQAQQRPAKQAHAYDRVTLRCPAKGCAHTLTIRATAAAKTRVSCREHDAEMSA